LATLDTIPNEIEIDLGHFNTFSIDFNANTLTIGDFVYFANITGPLYDARKEWRRLTIIQLAIMLLMNLSRS